MSSNTLSNVGLLRQRLSRFTVPVVVLALSTAGLIGVAGVVATEGRASAAVSAGGFVGVTPNRLLDTRETAQGPCVNGTRNLTVTGGATSIPTAASAVALNVTVVSPSDAGYLTVFPAGATRPTASNLNYLTGEIVPNGVYVKVGTSNQISIYASAGCPNVVVDVLGYFEGTTPVEAGGFVGLTPKRLLDTRESGQGPCVTETRNLTVTGGSTTVPDTAGAVSLNVTVVSPLTPGYVTVYPNGDSRPTASNLNYTTGQIVPNNVTVKVGTAGQVAIYAFGGCPDVVVDVVGYYEGGTPVLEGGFVGLTPKRLIDTRESDQGPCVDGTRDLNVTGGLTTVPDGANAVALNITVVSPSAPGYLTAFPAGATRPTASTLNYVAGQVVPNGTVVKVGNPGAISLYTNAGCPHVVVDVVGYYQGPPTIPADATAIAAGGGHSCALLSGGTVKCWGNNNYGELGDGTTTSSLVPVAVTGITTATAITAGYSYSCALLSGGTIKCWGQNSSGQLGNGTYGWNNGSSVPVSVTGITTATAITAGFGHSCALIVGGTVKCWGGNYYGELGDGTTNGPSVPVPVSVTGITTATAITAGSSYSCALLSGGAIKCWGQNSSGELGDGTTNSSSVAVSVTGITTATAITAGYSYSCALLSDGTIKCWGNNSSGQLGDGTITSSLVPVSVTGITTATAITTGYSYSCALLSGGTVKCWGQNSSGELGDGTITSSLVPVSVTGITTATSIRAGFSYSCALLSGGTVKCWGNNSSGQLGDGTTNSSSVPVSVTGITTATAITAGDGHTCALLSGGAVKCWGQNSSGQLGDGTTNSSLVPVAVTGITTATSIRAGFSYTCALLSGGTVKCWGNNRDGQLGDGTTNSSSVPVSVTGITTATAITAGFTYIRHTCALLSSGTVKCWGNNGDGQLGNGTTTDSLVPVVVTGITTAIAITTGDAHTCALLVGGAVKCWGANNLGQLGNGTSGWNTSSSVPVAVTGITTATAITAGYSYSCALLSGGTIKCWGGSPGDPTGITTAIAITAGGFHMCALLGDRTLKCWGNNNVGELGNGTTTDSLVPVVVTGITTATAITAGSSDTCALLVGGTVKCWGYKDYGQLGDGTTIYSSVPVSVIGL